MARSWSRRAVVAILHLSLLRCSADCILDASRYRASQSVQGMQFTGAYLLSLSEGWDCLNKITVSGYAANQSLLSYAAFYEQFYVFHELAGDPAHSWQEQESPFHFDTFGSKNGGGTPPEDAKVDLGMLRKMAAKIRSPEQRVPITDFWIPTIDLFHKLRDAHVRFNNGGTKIDAILKQFVLLLQDSATGNAVGLEVALQQKEIVPDGTASAILVTRDNKIVKSIGGKDPMEFLETIAHSTAFAYSYKSVGPRVNNFLEESRVGVAFLGSRLGLVSSLPNNLQVAYTDGTSSVWSWKWLLVTRNLDKRCAVGGNAYNATCVTEFLSHLLDTPGQLYRDGLQAWISLHASNFLESEFDIKVDGGHVVELPHIEMLETLRAESGLCELLGIPRDRVPGTDDFRALMAQSASNERTWFVDPTMSPTNSTYGFWQVLINEEDNKPYIVLKLTSFMLDTKDLPSSDFDFMDGFVDFWRDLTTQAQRAGIKRLLVDVVSNTGGYVRLAYAYVRAIYPDLPMEVVCNAYDRPIDSLFSLYEKIQGEALTEFLMKETTGRDRLSVLKRNKTALQQMMWMTDKVTMAGAQLELFSGDEAWMLSDIFRQSRLSMSNFLSIIGNLTQVAGSVGNPFAQSMGATNEDGEEIDPYNNPTWWERGGKSAEFTMKYRNEECTSLFYPASVDQTFSSIENPFTEILMLSDGLCGSSCDTSTRTTYLLSKKGLGSPQRTINYITFGGLGGSAEKSRTTLSATSFPGGNVQSAAMYTVYNPVFKLAAFGYLAAEWAGLDALKQQFFEFSEKVPQYPYYAEKLPMYSQSEIYQNALGPNALPTEYVFMPTDFYLPDWYYGLAGQSPLRWNEDELSRVYRDAAKAFGKTPGFQAAEWRVDWIHGSLVGAGLLLGAGAAGIAGWTMCKSRSPRPAKRTRGLTMTADLMAEEALSAEDSGSELSEASHP